MPDEMDAVQDRVLSATEAAIAAIRRDAAVGRAQCNCGEAISETRQHLGASRCIECQVEHERHMNAGRARR